MVEVEKEVESWPKKDPYQIIKHQHVTEKSMMLAEVEKQRK